MLRAVDLQIAGKRSDVWISNCRSEDIERSAQGAGLADDMAISAYAAGGIFLEIFENLPQQRYVNT